MTTSPTSPPAAIDNARWWQMTPGERFTIRTSATETGGRFTALEIVADPRNGVPLHVHANEEEHFIVLEGRVHLTNGEQRLELSAGDAATVKRGTPHAWCNLSDAPARMLVIFSPGHMEKVFRLIETVRDGDFTEIAAANERAGSIILGPPPYDDVYSVVSPRPA